MAFVDSATGRVVTATGPIFPITMKAASTCSPGDPIGQSSGWVQADADANIVAEFFAVGAAAAAAVVNCSRSITVDFGTGCTGAAGDRLYLGNTAGAVTSSAPTNAQIIGELLSAQVGTLSIPIPGNVLATITQTYSTADGTLGSPTAAAMGTTTVTTTTPYGYATTTQGNDVATQINALRTDLLDLAQFVNTIADQLQKVGILSP